MKPTVIEQFRRKARLSRSINQAVQHQEGLVFLTAIAVGVGSFMATNVIMEGLGR